MSLSGSAHVPERLAKQIGAEFWIPPDALLIAMSGATTGKTAFNRTGKSLLLNQRVGRIEAFSMNIDFVRIFFETIIGRNLRISFGNAIPNLSTRQIYETPIALPPLAEQHRIVQAARDCFYVCSHIEQGLLTIGSTTTRLLAALVLRTLELSPRKAPH